MTSYPQLYSCPMYNGFTRHLKLRIEYWTLCFDTLSLCLFVEDPNLVYLINGLLFECFRLLSRLLNHNTQDHLFKIYIDPRGQICSSSQPSVMTANVIWQLRRKSSDVAKLLMHKAPGRSSRSLSSHACTTATAERIDQTNRTSNSQCRKERIINNPEFSDGGIWHHA